MTSAELENLETAERYKNFKAYTRDVAMRLKENGEMEKSRIGMTY